MPKEKKDHVTATTTLSGRLVDTFVYAIQPLLPDFVLRFLIRLGLYACLFTLTYIDDYPNVELRFVREQLEATRRIVASLGEKQTDEEGRGDEPPSVAMAVDATPIAVDTEAANAQHYEVPTRFFQAHLGPRLKYSSCEWVREGKEKVHGIADAETVTLERYCREMGLEKLPEGL